MTSPPKIGFRSIAPNEVPDLEGMLALIVPPDGKLGPLARRVDRAAKGAVTRLMAGHGFAEARPGSVHALAYPAGLAAETVLVVKLAARPAATDARAAGGGLGAQFAKTKARLTILAPGQRGIEDVVLGLALRAYTFDRYRSEPDEAASASKASSEPEVHVAVREPEAAQDAFEAISASIEGTYLTRDLVNEPANTLTTTEFVRRLEDLSKTGLKVRVLDEDELERLGMRTLLAVGQGSESPSYVVVLDWRGGGSEAPLALAGKGVVFDTGGISIKPAAGMEQMTMDMGGAAVVAGTMKAIALRKARANVVGLVGLVENMPDGRAQRPGDVVRSMKGDTVEVINTDAEGRLVLADVLWYAQQEFKPRAIIDLATLTGAIIIALGHENAGVFANDDGLCSELLAAAEAEGEGAWRMPLGESYAKQLKSRIADIANVGGRSAGSVTAAEFLRRFVEEDTPWLHIDIAGVAYSDKDTALSPKGATGWGVRALDRLIRDRFEA